MKGSAINPIEKEYLSMLNFPKADVLKKASEKGQRSRLLHMAIILGNCFKNKVTIIFQSAEGINKLTATIWAVTDQHVIIKGGATLPISCVMDVKLF